MEKLDNIFSKLILVSGLVWISCSTIESNDPAVNKPQPEDSKPITLVIDKAFDFKNFRAHTLTDSANLDNPKEKLYAPSFSSPLIFTDNATGEVMALVHMDSTQSQVVVNAETVTKAFLELLPAYRSLNNQDRSKFLADSKSVKEFTDLSTGIGNLLKSRESIYSTKAEHVSKAAGLNGYLVKTYLENPAVPGGKLDENQETFSKWVTSANGASIVNQVKSFIHVEFTPIGQGTKISKLINPRNLYLAPSPVRVSELNVPDNCYTVKFSQVRSEAKSANTDEVAKRSVELVFDALFGNLGSRKNDCVAKIAGSLTSAVTGKVQESANSNDKVSKVFLGTLEAAKTAFVTNSSDLGCAKFLTSKPVIYKAIAKEITFFRSLFESIGSLKSGSETVPYILALVEGVELSEKLQLYEGNLLEACVKAGKDVALNAEYPGQEKIKVRIKIEAQSQYGVWKKSGFKVSWKLPSQNGILSAQNSTTTEDGIASVDWTLPDENNVVVTLTAELRDKEGEHLFGSPINFQVKVIRAITTITDARDGNVYKTVKIGTQTWFAENLRYSVGIPEVPSQQVWQYISRDGIDYPAWVKYDNNPANNAIYGKLYNWYAVNTGTLCPSGWHIPTDEEWTVLTNFLGGESVAGDKMKSVTGWDAPKTEATNSSGFTGLPGGIRDVDGYFGDLRSKGIWWSSTSSGLNNSWSRILYNSTGNLSRYNGNKADGFSCRCVKD